LQKPISLKYTHHAGISMAQRGLSRQDIEYVCRYGQSYRCAGVVHRFLRHIDIPDGDRKQKEHLEGTVVLLDKAGRCVITAYRNRQALKSIRRKSKRGLDVAHRGYRER